MYRLIGPLASRALRVGWALQELELDYEWEAAQPRSARVREFRADGKVPILLTDEGPLTDSVAICTFLADRHGGLTHEPGSYARGRQDAVTQFAVDEIEGALWTAAKHSFVLPEDLRTPDVKRACRHEFAKAMETLEVRLGEGPFVMGERFTIPDILLGHASFWARAAKIELPGGAVGAYFERLAQRPALTRARQRGAQAEAEIQKVGS